jgi:hypothetical protein
MGYGTLSVTDAAERDWPGPRRESCWTRGSFGRGAACRAIASNRGKRVRSTARSHKHRSGWSVIGIDQANQQENGHVKGD